MRIGIRTWVVVTLLLGLTSSAGSGEGIPSSAQEIRPVSTGDKLPAANLRTPDGQEFDLSGAIAAKPTVLIFYRGGW